MTQDTYLRLELEGGQSGLILARLQGREALSELFQFQVWVEVRADDFEQSANMELGPIVGHTATITLTSSHSDDPARYLHSIVSEARFLTSDTRGTSLYLLELRPWLWQLTLNRCSRIFQNKTVPDIIKEVLSGVNFSAYRFDLTSSYEARTYCVQYNESDFNFLSRLMELEGISYFFEHASSAHTLVLVDTANQLIRLSDGVDVPYERSPTLAGRLGSALTCAWGESVVPGRYGVNDYNFETPSVTLDTDYNDLAVGMRVYEYPAGFVSKGQGESLAKRRLQAYTLEREILRGTSASRPMFAGGWFTLAGHPRNALNRDYVLRAVQVEATIHDGYSNHFEALPSNVALRPPPRTPRPTISGSQTAVVVGASGEEIEVDKYGRIKVQFHWDELGTHDDKSSCWIRVAQTWAGSSWGSAWVPRVGQEVVVTFLEGDPDRPLIIGAVYNGDNLPPLTYPDDKTRSVWKSSSSLGGEGFNAIGFEDKKDQEELWMQAQRDMKVTVLNDQTSTITQNRTATVTEGNEALTVSKGNRTITIAEGNEEHTVAGTRSVSVTKNESHTNSEGNFTHKVEQGNYVLNVTGDLTIKVTGAVTIEAGKALTLKCGQSGTFQAGQSLTCEAGQSITVQAAQSLTQKAGQSISQEGGMSITTKSGGLHNVESGGILSLKGSLVKIN